MLNEMQRAALRELLGLMADEFAKSSDGQENYHAIEIRRMADRVLYSTDKITNTLDGRSSDAACYWASAIDRVIGEGKV